MPTTDLEQRVREAIVAVLDTLPAIVALTGRNSGNLVPDKIDDDIALPAVVYNVIAATNAGALGDTREVVVQFTAVAARMSLANALLEVVEDTLNAPAFYALTPPLDACAIPGRDVRRPGADLDDEGGTIKSALLDRTLLVTK